MAEHAPDRFWSGIDIPKTIAGTLAAVSAAVVGSFLGVAGTLIGAAVASLVGSVGTELYHRWINRGSQKIKSTFVTAPAAVGTPEVAAAADDKPSEQAVAEPAAVAAKAPAKFRWGRIAAVAGALFILAMGSLTAFELVSGRSMADAVGNKTSQSTTIGSAFSSDDKDSSPTPAPSDSESANPDESTTPTDEPSAPTSTEPSSPAATDSPLPTETDGTGETPAPDQGGTQPEEPAQDGGSTDQQDGPTQQDGSTQQQQDGFTAPGGEPGTTGGE